MITGLFLWIKLAPRVLHRDRFLKCVLASVQWVMFYKLCRCQCSLPLENRRRKGKLSNTMSQYKYLFHYNFFTIKNILTANIIVFCHISTVTKTWFWNLKENILYCIFNIYRNQNFESDNGNEAPFYKLFP